MGDRGNIVIRQEPDTNRADVWFYTHWSGSNIKQVTQAALARRVRWNDYSYLARIIFNALTKGSEAEETGFGISTELQDNEHPILVIDCPGQMVYTIDEDDLDVGRLPDHPTTKAKEQWSFESFLIAKLSDERTALYGNW